MKWLIGLAAGAAAIYFLKTDKGKALVEDLKKEGKNVGESLYTMAEDLYKKGSLFAGKAVEKANEAV